MFVDSGSSTLEDDSYLLTGEASLQIVKHPVFVTLGESLIEVSGPCHLR